MAALAAAFLFAGGSPQLRAATAQIDAAATQQVIRGFGGATVFQPPGLPASLSTGELDTLFGNGPTQIGLTLLRIRVAADDAWRAIELAHARGAIARGAQVIATPWSPPAAMKTNNSLIAGALAPTAYADYAKYLNDFALTMAANGAPLYAISVQNEPDISVTYESCDWTPQQMLTFCRDNAGAITATRVIAPESFQFRRTMSDPILNDATAAENVDIIGGHIYGGGLAPYPLAVSKGKEVWMTEFYDNQQTDWAGALATAKNIHDCLATANFSAYIWWYLRRFYGPLGEDGVVTKRGWVMAQFSKFIRPGYSRVNATANPVTGVFVSAYKREKLVVVAINQTTAPVEQAFSIAGANVTRVTPWVSSATANVQAQSPLAVSGGAFTATLEPQSVTTFVGDIIFPTPTIATPPQNHNVTRGSTAVFDVAATGEALSYQWNKNGAMIPGATDRVLTLAKVGDADAGDFTVTVNNSGGAVTSATAKLTLTDGRARLANLSTRASAGVGDNTAILGFVVTGTASRSILVRGSGPALNTLFGLGGTLGDPVIELRDSAGALVVANDDWDVALEPTFAAVGAFGLPRGSKDAAVLRLLAPGAYTAQIRGRDDAAGVALLEIYDAGDASATPLINVSARTNVGTGAAVQIGGFVLTGNAAGTVVIRASGPALHKSFGLAGTLADPVIELHAADERVLATSDDWENFLAPHFASVGAFPWLGGSRDAALVATLEPGAYSVVVRGKNGAGGVALLEIYSVR